jgi:hypothetical protein
MVTFLSAVYEKLLAGFVSPAAPHVDQMRQWGIAGNLAGAVQIYGGYNAIEQLFDGPPFRPTDVEFAAFVARFRINNMARRVAGYEKLGLGKVWETIQSLSSFAGVPAETMDLHAGWSVRSIDRDLPPDAPSLAGALSVRSVVVRLHAIIKTSGTPTPLPRPLSLREALNAIVIA